MEIVERRREEKGGRKGRRRRGRRRREEGEEEREGGGGGGGGGGEGSDRKLSLVTGTQATMPPQRLIGPQVSRLTDSCNTTGNTCPHMCYPQPCIHVDT